MLISTFIWKKNLIFFYIILMKYSISISTVSLKNSFESGIEKTIQNQTKPEHILSITGIAYERVDANIIVFGINIQTKELNLIDSYHKNTISSNKITKIFKDLNIQERNITTKSYTMEKVINNVWVPANQTYIEVFEGFSISNKIEIGLSEIDKLSNLLSEIISVENILVSKIEFLVSRNLKKKIQDRLLREAADDALERAKITADMLDVNIIDVKTINVEQLLTDNIDNENENDYRGVLRSGRKASLSSASPSPKIYSATSNIQSKVYINFILQKI